MKRYVLSLRVKWAYFDAIKRGVKTREIRRASPFWNQRCQRAQIALREGERFDVKDLVAVEAVFTSGPHIHRRKVTKVLIADTPELALGHIPTDVETEMVGKGACWVIYLGDAL